jgi:hypothetical protein
LSVLATGCRDSFQREREIIEAAMKALAKAPALLRYS